MEDTDRPGDPNVAQGNQRPAPPVRHALRDQDSLWAEFLAMGLTAVDSLSKSIAVVCEGRFDVVHEVKSLERASDRAEVRIEKECLRILALFEPVASDLRRMATVLKVKRDWERIADLAARVARRCRKLAQKADGLPVPEQLKSLARDVLAHVCARLRCAGQPRCTPGTRCHRERPGNRSPISSASRCTQGIAPPQPWPARRLAPVNEHCEKPPANCRSCHRHRAGRRLPGRGKHHPAQRQNFGRKRVILTRLPSFLAFRGAVS